MAESPDPDEPAGAPSVEPTNFAERGDVESLRDEKGEGEERVAHSVGLDQDGDHDSDELEEEHEEEEEDEGEENEEDEEAGEEIEGSDLGTDTDERDYRAQRTTITGDRNRVVQKINTGGTLERPSFRPLARRDLERARAIFVEPRAYRPVVPTLLEESHPRVFLVHGPDHCGKRTCAARLAQDLLPLLPTDEGRRVAPIQRYARPDGSEISLADAITGKRLPRRSIVLLYDCFEYNVRPEELEVFSVGELRDALATAESLLVLTGELRGEQLEAVSTIKLDAQVTGLLHQVLRTNLTYSVEHDGLALAPRQLEIMLAEDLWRELEPKLTTPFHIYRFCSRLRDLVGKGKDDASLRGIALKVARTVSVVGRQVGRVWFEKELSTNEKLFGILVYLFAGAERLWLEELNRELIRRLRADGLDWLADPRQCGLDDALERLQLVERDGRLEFTDHSYEDEIRRQVTNRHHLLWDALSQASDPGIVPATAEVWKRQAFGMALGRLGAHDPSRLASTLEKIAKERDRRRTVIPGYALQELVRTGSTLDAERALGILAYWVRSRDRRLMWAAAAASWRVFLANARADAGVKPHFADHVLLLLRKLSLELRSLPSTGKQDEPAKWQVEGGLVEALRQISLANPQRGSEELCIWLAGRTPKRQLACRTIRTLCSTFSRRHSRPSEAQLACLLRWVVPLLSTSQDTFTADLVLLTLRAWLRAPEAADRIGRELLRQATHESTLVGERLRSALTRLWLEPQPKDATVTAHRMVSPSGKASENQLDAGQRRKINRLLAFWCDGSEVDARWIARAVIARSYALEGMLPSAPTMGRAVAVVDPELLAADQADSSRDPGRTLWRLLTLLGSRFELTFLRLGETVSISLSEEALAPLHLASDFPTHRLVMPGLSSLAVRGSEHVFILSARPPHDLDDLADLPWVSSVCCIGPSFDSAATESTRDWLALPWPPTAEQLGEAEEALEDRFSRALAMARPELWLDLLHGWGIEPGDEEHRSALLSTWALALDDLPSRDDLGLDPVWSSVVLLLFLHACDPEGTLALIASWLTASASEPPAANQRVVARAASLALVRLATAYSASDIAAPRASTRLFDLLAHPLASQGADGVAAIVRLVTHWLDDPLWARFLAGDAQLGQGRLERWAAIYLNDNPALAERLSQRLSAAQSASAANDDWVALMAAMDRLRALRALEYPRTLPPLQPDQGYAVLVVNTTDGRRERHLAALAGSLCADLVKSSGARLIPVIYRMGETRPFWTDTAEGPAPERLLPSEIRLPPLVGPLLETLDADRVAVVLLLSSIEPIDLADWLETAWWRRVRLYGGGEELPQASFATLPRPLLETGPAVPAADEQETTTLARLLAGLGDDATVRLAATAVG